MSRCMSACVSLSLSRSAKVGDSPEGAGRLLAQGRERNKSEVVFGLGLSGLQGAGIVFRELPLSKSERPLRAIATRGRISSQDSLIRCCGSAGATWPSQDRGITSQ